MGRPAGGAMRDETKQALSFRGLVELASEAMAALDREGRVVAVNAALVQAAGEAAEGAAFETLLRADDLPAWRDAWGRLGSGGRAWVTARVAGGAALAWTLQASEVEGAVYVVGRPAPARSPGEIHLEVLRSVIANLPLVLFAVDTQGEVLLLEGQGLAAIGLQPLDCAAGPRSAFEVFRAVPPLCEGIRRALAGAAQRGVFEYLERHFETWTAPLVGPQGHPHGAIGLASDVTDAVKSERRLRDLNEKLELARDEAIEASRAKSAFLANMSHELRTPLNAIIGYSEIAIDELRGLVARTGGAELIQLCADVGKIHVGGTHLLGIISDILDLSKIEAGRMELHVETFTVQSMIDDVASTAGRLVAQNGNKFVVRGGPDLGEMTADLTKVRQILFNLLSNAAKFTEQGTVTLEVKRGPGAGDGSVEFAVIDSGIGMSPDQKDHLFQSFYQGDSSSTRKYGGTGLGLAISRRFIQMMGGEVTVQTSLGTGSTFFVRLPARVSGQAVPLETEVSTPEADVTSPEVEVQHLTAAEEVTRQAMLVIDDDPNVYDMMERILSREGLDVYGAATGKEGLALARRLKPVVIALDIMMPGMDGWAVLQAIRADPELKDTRVVIVSMLDEKPLGMALGADDYLTKPLRREQLLACIQRLVPVRDGYILLVEDDAALRELLQRTLIEEGWSVRIAETGTAALELIEKSRPGLILLDLKIPEVDGFAVISSIRERPEFMKVPITVITAVDLGREAWEQLQGRVEQVIQKGLYSRNRLLREVRRLATHFVGRGQG
jgi:signal transduction histidine kinase/CheY-like chemotaxis protein